MRADLLADPIPGLAETMTVIGAFDRVLRDGFGHPDPAHTAGLEAVLAAVAATPLAAATAEAVAGVGAGSVTESHLSTLAAARSALLGSVYDAVTARADEATGRRRTPIGGRTSIESTHPHLLAAARGWLADLARPGWRNLDHEAVAAAEPVIASLLGEPGLRRLATVLSGFAGELDVLCPGATVDAFPERRWADLWSRALLLTHAGFDGQAESTSATGRLLPLGVDLTEHPTAALAQVHAVLEPTDGSAPRLVRASVSSAKPHTVVDAGVWRLLTPHLSLLTAAARGHAVEIDGMPLTATGDLVWDEALAHPAGPADPFATARVALQTACTGALDPLDRHPVALAEPVFVEGYTVTVEDGAVGFDLPGHRLAVDARRVPTAGPLTPEAVRASSSCIGLLRWDAGAFHLQPLAVETTVKKKTVALHAGAWAAGTTDKDGAKADKAAELALTTLRERAGKLLRA